MSDPHDDPAGMSLHDLFRSEAESQARILGDGLLMLERHPDDLARIEPLMRAAHSLKGAARIVDMQPVERLSHVMEDCFVAAQQGRLRLGKRRIDRLLEGVDLIMEVAAVPEAEAQAWLERNKLRIANLQVAMYEATDPTKLADDAAGASLPPAVPAETAAPAPVAPPAAFIPEPVPVTAPGPTAAPPRPSPAPADPARDEQVLRISARSFDRLLALASEARVTAHAMQPQLQALQRFKQRQQELLAAVDAMAGAVASGQPDERLQAEADTLRERAQPLRMALLERIAAFDAYERRLLSASQELLDEVLALRMRPFRDGIQGFPRLVRDLSHRLGKEVQLEVRGADTLVDRDILGRMESVLTHLLRNALDHGIEPPDERTAAGKPRTGTLVLEASHRAGMLGIRVCDDGRGADLERIRAAVVRRQLAPPQIAAALSATELLDFLFLPGFSLKETTTEVSGRGVGLDAVQETVRQLYGSIRIESHPGRGMQTEITLPLSQSIIRVIVVDIAGEAYALPLSKVERVLRVASSSLHTLEGRQFFTLDGQHVRILAAAPLLELGDAPPPGPDLPVVVIGSAAQRHGLVVDTIRGEQSLAVQPLDPALGKMRDIAAAGLLDDGSPVLVLDTADLLADIARAAQSGAAPRLANLGGADARAARRILVVDDSLTVREMERKLLTARGYAVDVAVDGMDAWNAVRGGKYDLVITDVDMPRMDGIELVRLIKRDDRLRRMPVMIVSYKDRPEDRARGVEAGADFYLTKGSFHDETLIEAVVDLIGEDI